MIRLVVALAAGCLVAGCDVEPTRVGPGAAAERRTVERMDVPPRRVELPPSIVATRRYRCVDGAAPTVEFYSDGLTAGVRMEREGPETRLRAASKGSPFVDEGWSLKGDQSAERVDLISPGAARPKSCRR